MKKKTRRNPKITSAKKRLKVKKAKIRRVSEKRWRHLMRLEKEEGKKVAKARKVEKYKDLMTEHIYNYRNDSLEEDYLRYKEVRNLLYDEFPRDARLAAYDAIIEAGFDEEVAENMSEWSD